MQVQFCPPRGAALAALFGLVACGGGDGGTPPPTVASVVITSPAAAPSFQTLGRSAQFTAQARDAAGAPVAATITWSSSNGAAASVSGSGLVTAVANGTAGITASAGGQVSSPVGVTVAQAPGGLGGLPATISFGALGSQRTLAGTVLDSGGAAIPGATVTYAGAGAGACATITGAGVVTSTGIGSGDTVVASAGALVQRIPISVAQITASVLVTSTSASPDTLYTTGRQRQFSATVRDSNGNAIGSAAVVFSSNLANIASVGSASGLVTAVSDGSANISAVSGNVTGLRPVVVRRFPITFTMAPSSGAISTAGGALGFSGSATDSANVSLPVTWASRTTSVATVSPSAGATTTATAVNNGTTFIVMAAGSGRDSALVTVSNQPGVSFVAAIQPIFNTNCALSGCHIIPTLTGNLNLSAATSYAQLVGVSANGFVGAVRVIAGDPSNSYLIRKLEGNNITGGRMPEGGSPLPPSTIQLIRDWITQGALNN